MSKETAIEMLTEWSTGLEECIEEDEHICPRVVRERISRVLEELK